MAGLSRGLGHGLALGGTRALPELYAAAGARLPFDREAVAEAARLVAEQLAGAMP